MTRSLFLIALLCGAGITHGAGGPAVDQSHLITNPNHGFAIAHLSPGQRYLIQTFTVGQSGKLAGVDLQLWKTEGTTGNDLVVDVLPTDANGNPLLSSLYSTSVPVAAIALSNEFLPQQPPILNVDLRAGNVIVEAGDVLAVALSRIAVPARPWVLWASNDNIHYGGGDLFHYQDGNLIDFDIDAGFRTYIVPEPSAFAVAASALLLIAATRRCTR